LTIRTVTAQGLLTSKEMRYPCGVVLTFGPATILAGAGAPANGMIGTTTAKTITTGFFMVYTPRRERAVAAYIVYGLAQEDESSFTARHGGGAGPAVKADQ
jgi:hypothetical protein